MEGLQKSAKFVMAFGTKDEDSLPAKSFMSEGYIITFHYLMCNAEDGTIAKAKEFWESVIEKEAKKDTPAYKLYKKFDKIRNTADMRLSRDEMVWYCIQGMYSFLYGEKVNWTTVQRDLCIGGLDWSLIPEDGEE